MRRYEVTDFPWYFLTIFYIVRRSFTDELVYFVNIKQFGGFIKLGAPEVLSEGCGGCGGGAGGAVKIFVLNIARRQY